METRTNLYITGISDINKVAPIFTYKISKDGEVTHPTGNSPNVSKIKAGFDNDNTGKKSICIIKNGLIIQVYCSVMCTFIF